MMRIFQDAAGKPSNMRVMSFLSLLYAFFAATWQMTHESINFEVLVLFMTGAFAPKVIQKFAERAESK